MALYSIEGDVSGIIPDAGKNKSVISGSRVLAVSYTHLDVYKRQVHPLCGSIAELCRGAL